jgi:hypothetical protein
VICYTVLVQNEVTQLACSHCHESKSTDDFYVNRSRVRGFSYWCKLCVQEDYAEKHPTKPRPPRTVTAREYDPIKGREYWLRHAYGMSLEDWQDMFDRQDGKCAICGTTEPGGKGTFHTDHDHDTGVVRGLLCQTCNQAIGLLKHDPARIMAAAVYVAHPVYGLI